MKRESTPNKTPKAAFFLASKLAQELDLPIGNYWEAGIARNIEMKLSLGISLLEIETTLRFQLGMAKF